MLEPSQNSDLPAIPGKRYFTIGEVSELCEVKTHVLRYWEQEFPQLKPLKRRGNRRSYQRQDVILVRQIRSLLYEQGFTIGGARQRLSGRKPGKTRIKVNRSFVSCAPSSRRFWSCCVVSPQSPGAILAGTGAWRSLVAHLQWGCKGSEVRILSPRPMPERWSGFRQSSFRPRACACERRFFDPSHQRRAEPAQEAIGAPPSSDRFGGRGVRRRKNGLASL